MSVFLSIQDSKKNIIFSTSMIVQLEEQWSQISNS